MEKDWVNEQKQFQQLKILEKIEKGKTQSVYTQKYLERCKRWNGPATSVEELHTILNSNPVKREKIVRTKLSSCQDTHKADVIQQPDFFKINGISHDKQLLNLCNLLAEHDLALDFVSLPLNKDAATVLLSCNSVDPTQAQNEEDLIETGRYYIPLMTEGKMNIWYIASCEGKNLDGTYKMDHLQNSERVRSEMEAASENR